MYSIQKKIKSANIKLTPGKLFFGPEWIVLGVNNICNLHCKMCDVGTQSNSTIFAQNLVGTSPRDMPEKLVYRIIDQIKKYFPKTKLGYAFTEPLIYPHLISSLHYANKNGIYTTVTTNALNLSKVADEICKADLKELFISLDGPQDIHNFIRGHKSSFQRAIEGIKKILMHEKRPSISVFCVITEWNVQYLKDFADYFSNFPLKTLGFLNTNYTPEHIAILHNEKWGEYYKATSSNIDETHVELTNLDVLWNQMQSINSTNYPFPVTFSPAIKSREALSIFYHQPEVIIGKRCNDAFSNIMIKSDGSVIPAHGRCYNIDCGNIYHQELNTLWNHKNLQKFRKDLIGAGGLFPACSRCCSAF